MWYKLWGLWPMGDLSETLNCMCEKLAGLELGAVMPMRSVQSWCTLKCKPHNMQAAGLYQKPQCKTTPQQHLLPRPGAHATSLPERTIALNDRGGPPPGWWDAAGWPPPAAWVSARRPQSHTAGSSFSGLSHPSFFLLTSLLLQNPHSKQFIDLYYLVKWFQ